jgi:glycosyltransferase involved in cell wall biosynthesis
MPSSFSESKYKNMLGDNCRFLPFHAASWVNPNLYCENSINKDIDIIMLANFSQYKRHWRLFQALSKLPSDLTVVLAGVPLRGRTAKVLLNEARLFGVENRFRLIENAPDNTIREYLERSKIMCALSHREGSYVGVAEALFANTAVAMYENAIIGTKNYINDKTGVLLNPNKSLESQLSHALALYNQFSPREWAVSRISAQVNCTKLNELLKKSFFSQGLEWSSDLKQFYCCRFKIFNFHDKPYDHNCMEREYRQVEDDFGIIFVNNKFNEINIG